MSHPKTPAAVKTLSRDFYDRIMRAEFVTKRKRAAFKDLTRTPPRVTLCQSWNQILKVMR